MKPLLVFVVLLGLMGCGVHPVASVSRGTWTDTSVPNLVAQQRGATYAQANCSGCHAVGLRGESPLPAAPHFRDLGLRYPVEDLAEAFAEGIDTGHPAMPEFVLSPQENTDLIAYLKSIQVHSTR